MMPKKTSTIHKIFQFGTGYLLRDHIIKNMKDMNNIQ